MNLPQKFQIHEDVLPPTLVEYILKYINTICKTDHPHFSTSFSWDGNIHLKSKLCPVLIHKLNTTKQGKNILGNLVPCIERVLPDYYVIPETPPLLHLFCKGSGI